MHRSVPVSRLDDVVNSDRGLSYEESAAREKQYGPNTIIEIASHTWLTLLWDTARDPMLWFLFGTAALFIFLGNKVEAATLLAAVVPLVGMDLYLHRRTQASTEGLSSRLAAEASVLRDGKVVEIPATQIVPGDLVLLAAGQNIPADGILVSATSTQVDESTLTGEAYAIRKQAITRLDTSLTEPAVDSVHWVYAGTRLLTGSAAVRIVYTGAETLYGEIVRSSSLSSHERTPLQSAIANLVSVLIVVAALMCLLLAWVRLQQGFGFIDAILSAVTLAVAALPEEFPVVFTFFLGVGVYRLARRNALVRRAVVVENIGRVSCICSDKTGTITAGELQLAHLFPDNTFNNEQLLAVAATASRKETGDPMDLAISNRAGTVEAADSTLATFPFTEDRKRETAVVRNAEEVILAATKGAPETIFTLCSLSDIEHTQWKNHVVELAKTGHKVIACAQRSISESDWTGDEPDREFTFAGLLAFEDPVREGVADSIANCKQSGIHIIMVTGDHPATAASVAREIGLGSDDPRVIEGDQLDMLIEKNPAELYKVDVIARAVPAQKLSLVRSLKSLGEVVAVTGDGVNDVPALQAADVGLAMGERGTRSAREVAAIVLLDDNFRTIVRAIAEGRQLFRNLKLSFAYLLMIHIPLVLTAALIPLAGYPLLYLPIHIVWLELIIHPTALLVFQELPASERLTPIKKTSRLRFFSGCEWFVIACVGLLATLMIIAAYRRSFGTLQNVEHARAMSMVTLAFASAFITVVLSGFSSRIAHIVVAATIILTLLLVQIPVMAGLLHLTPLHIDDLMISTIAALCLALIATFGRFGRHG